MTPQKPREKERDMFDHIQLKVKDLQSSKRFYTAALAPLGFSMEYEGDGVIGFGPKGARALWLREGKSGGPAHIAGSKPVDARTHPSALFDFRHYLVKAAL